MKYKTKKNIRFNLIQKQKQIRKTNEILKRKQREKRKVSEINVAQKTMPDFNIVDLELRCICV
jgi:hypothetical protein